VSTRKPKTTKPLSVIAEAIRRHSSVIAGETWGRVENSDEVAVFVAAELPLAGWTIVPNARM
jgi:hypothetical protein